MASSTELSQMQKETVRTVQWHLLPILMIGMICAFLDRINIGFAGLKMNADLGLSPAAFGLAAGAFFIGYFIFEVPSNLMMAKFGPRKWLTRIMFTWGIVAALTAFSGNKYGLYTFRFLLGVAEAGFFPGLVLYITYFFRTEDHAQAVGFLFLGSVTGIIIGGPLSGWLLGMTALGFRGWQWLFIVEGLMPMVYAVFLWFYLPDTPEKAKWLKPEQKEWLVKVIAEENAKKETPKHIGVFQALTRPGTMLFFLVYFLTGIGYLGQQLWMPQLLKAVGKNLSSIQIGLLTMLPAFCTVITLVFWSRHSDKTGERQWHYCLGAYVAAAGLLLYLVGANSILIAVLGVCIVGLGAAGPQSIFWTAVTELLGKKEAAAAFALVNSGAALGGFVGPFAIGIAKGIFGNFAAAIILLAACYVISAFIMHAFFIKTGIGKSKAARARMATARDVQKGEPLPSRGAWVNGGFLIKGV